MDSEEEFFVKNYTTFGSATQRLCKFTDLKVKAIREKYKKKGIYLLPNKKLAEKNMPIKRTRGGGKKDNLFSPIQLTVAALGPVDQEKLIEMAKYMPEPQYLMDQAIALQHFRVQMGVENETQQGRLLDSTEAAISNLVTMIQAKKTIEEGQEVNINVNNSISSLLDEIDTNEEITIDVDKKEAKK